MASCSFAIGETIRIGIEALGATNDDLIAATCTASLKAAIETVGGWTVPPGTSPAVATFAVVARSASSDIGPGWDLMIAPDISAALVAGTYVTNAVITVASGLVVKTAPLFITIAQATS